MAANENFVFGIKKLSFNGTQNGTSDNIGNFVVNLISNSEKAEKPITILCIGTDRSTGDSLGPLVGMMLTEKGIDAKIIGTLDNPLHATNLQETVDSIDTSETFIIAIDACLGKMDNVGKIHVSKGGIKPGTGVDKTHLPIVGDISISPVVNFGGYMDFLVLQNTRLSAVYGLAKIVSEAVADAVETVRSKSFELVAVGRD